MISDQEIKLVVKIAKKYKIGQLYLIGSSLYKTSSETRDYDFAAKDVPSEFFFKFYAELIKALPKNVDLIDLSGEKTKFKDIVQKEGKLIYEKEAA